MATTLAWGETLEVKMELGFPVNEFTIGNTTSGVIGDSDYFIGGTMEGLDVSEFVQSLSTSRGRPDQLATFVAGSATIQLDNRDRRFDPINESSPYWNPATSRSGVVPRRKVTIKCDGDPIFVGRITDVDVVYQPVPLSSTQELSSVTITAADDFTLLANTVIETTVTPTEQLSGARVSAILDLPEVSYPSTTRSIDAGVAVLGGGATFAISPNTNVLSYLQEITQAEEGRLFIDRAGFFTFQNRIQPTFANPVADFADDGSGIDYQTISVVYGAEFLYNRVSCTVTGGTEQVVEDVDSQDEYGIITLALDDLLLKDDASALVLAQLLLDRYAQPEYRFDRIQIIYNNKSSLNRTTLTQIEIGDQVDVTRTFRTGTPASVTLPYTIEGIRHTLTPQSHLVNYSLAATTVLQVFIIGDAVYGVIGTTNAVA